MHRLDSWTYDLSEQPSVLAALCWIRSFNLLNGNAQNTVGKLDLLEILSARREGATECEGRNMGVTSVIGENHCQILSVGWRGGEIENSWVMVRRVVGLKSGGVVASIVPLRQPAFCECM